MAKSPSQRFFDLLDEQDEVKEQFESLLPRDQENLEVKLKENFYSISYEIYEDLMVCFNLGSWSFLYNFLIKPKEYVNLDKSFDPSNIALERAFGAESLNYINQLLYDFDPGHSTAKYDKLIWQ